MVQRNYDIPTANGITFRQDIDGTFKAAVTQNSGPLQPSSRYPFMVWADTTSGLLKQRNENNSAWIDIGPMNQPALGIPSKSFPIGSIYQNKTNTANPSTYLGFGTWVKADVSNLISEVTLATAGSTIALDVSQMVVGEHYRLDLEGSLSGAAGVNMFVNGNLTQSNYYFTDLSASGATIVGSSGSAPRIGANLQTGSMRISCDIFSHSGEVSWISTGNQRISGPPSIHVVNGQAPTIQTWTALQLFTSTTGVNLNAGTRARLFRDLVGPRVGWQRTA